MCGDKDSLMAEDWGDARTGPELDNKKIALHIFMTSTIKGHRA